MIRVLDWLLDLKYLAMFGILFLCGMGLPIPEEVTLVGSGLLVGWEEADFFYSSAACVLGILAGDSIIFGLGHHYGRQFLLSRPMRLLIPPRRQFKVARFFARHGTKAVFFARFFAGVRIGVYAYAGSQRMGWLKFLFLDLLGALISGPASILIGAWAARQFAADRAEATKRGLELVHRFGAWLIVGVILLIALVVAFQVYSRRRGSPVQAVSLPPLSGSIHAEAGPEKLESPDPVISKSARSED